MQKTAIFAFLIALSGYTGCTATNDATTATAPATVAAEDATARLMEQLTAAGVPMQPAGTLTQPFFTVPARVFTHDGADLQVFEFATAADAERAAQSVAPGGGTIGTTSMAWMAAPHFFRKDTQLAIYLGQDRKTLDALSAIFGPQFAGR